MGDSGMTRHGNNFHPQLPACPFCGEWAWRSGDTTIGHGIEAWYFCQTDGCRGTGLVVWCALGLAVIFEREQVDCSCQLPALETAWINTGARALQGARINECVHGGATPPTSLPIDAPAPRRAYIGLEAWMPAQQGERVDLGSLFCEHVARLRARDNKS